MNDQAQPSQPRCLWVARELPYPANTGDRTYSGRLACALAQAGVAVSYLGLDATQPGELPVAAGPQWLGVPGVKKPYWIAVFSRFPLVAASHATPAMRRRLHQLLEQQWDAIVLDHYATAWALDAVLRSLKGRRQKTVLVHIAQNHEELLAYSLYQSYSGPWIKRAVLYLNYLRIRHWERRLAREVDVVGAITEEDREGFRVQGSAPDLIVVTPGYSGQKPSGRRIEPSVPRRVVVAGSFRWVVKQENLRQLLVAADARFAEHGITLDIIGDVPTELQEEFAGRLSATVFHGFVSDFAPLFDAARIALVPEVIGGGFKLKFLDYLFGRVPIATISEAAAGLPEEVREHFLLCPTMDELVQQVIAHIDDVPLLDRMQDGAFRAAANLYDWRDRGEALAAAIRRHQALAA